MAWALYPQGTGARSEHSETRDISRTWGFYGYRVGHCMIGTVLIAFAGEPLIILVLIAR